MGTALQSALETHREELIRSWKDRVAGVIAPETTDSTIIDTLPVLLDRMVEALNVAATGAMPSTDDVLPVGTEHGSQRFKAGFSLGAVVREYGVLRECLFDFIQERGIAVDLNQVQVMMRVINAAIAAGVEQYMRERDAMVARQSADHFAFIAHELRNPLSSAVMAADAIARNARPEDAARSVRLKRGLERLRGLIDQTLVDVRLRGAGRQLQMHVERLILQEIVSTAVSETAGEAEDKDMALVANVEEGLTLQGDRRLIESVVHNLIRNAVKFSRAGGTIEVRARGGDQLVSLEVQDECGGLPPGSAQELFTPYVQRGRDRTGFGLGLAIVKHAVEAHGGTVQVGDLPGQGCIFMVSLPAAGPPPPEP